MACVTTRCLERSDRALHAAEFWLSGTCDFSTATYVAISPASGRTIMRCICIHAANASHQVSDRVANLDAIAGAVMMHQSKLDCRSVKQCLLHCNRL